MPIESTNAVIKILKRGSPNPPKKPTINMRSVATETIAGITQMELPMLPTSTPARIAESAISTNMAIAMG